MGSGDEKRMREEYDRICKLGIPGSIQLLDENGRIKEQHAGFAADKPRRYKDADGTPYDPTVVAIGAPPLDLSRIADAIKAMPETDPALDPEPGKKTTPVEEVSTPAGPVTRPKPPVEPALRSVATHAAERGVYQEPPKQFTHEPMAREIPTGLRITDAGVLDERNGHVYSKADLIEILNMLRQRKEEVKPGLTKQDWDLEARRWRDKTTKTGKPGRRGDSMDEFTELFAEMARLDRLEAKLLRRRKSLRRRMITKMISLVIR